MIQIKKEEFIPLKELIQKRQSENLELIKLNDDLSFEIRGKSFTEGNTPKDHVQNKVTFRILQDSIKILNLYFIDKRTGAGFETIRWLENFAISKGIFKAVIYGVNTDNIPMMALCNKLEYRIKSINERENYYDYEKELT